MNEEENILSVNSNDSMEDPLFGKIRSVRYSIEKLFGATADTLSSSNLSVVSSSSSTNAKKMLGRKDDHVLYVQQNRLFKC
jgi:hypothetical protein